MFSFPRFICKPNSSSVRIISNFKNKSEPSFAAKNGYEQMEHIKSALERQIDNWPDFKSDVLSKYGIINQKNIDAVLLKCMVNYQKLDAAVSYAEFIKKNNSDLPIGSINGLLSLYHELGKQNKLSDTEKEFILETYKSLYAKYKVLDSTTCERLLHALCVINEDEKCFKVLEDIYQTSKPSHSAFSSLIATLFNLNKKTEAKELIQRSLNCNRPLTHTAYDGWINYIFRKYKNKKTKVKHLEEIAFHVSNNFVVLPEATAEKIKETYASLGWKAEYTSINKQNGQCSTCKRSLDNLGLTEEEFTLLQQNVKEKLIVGSNLFLKTSPEELKKFLNFLDRTAPYDIVLDALNIAFSVGKFNNHNVNKVNILSVIVHKFREQNKKILLLGRKHMHKWPKRPMDYIKANTSFFFTEDISQDDPYFITAAIMSGPNTDIVSKDQLRGHRFNMQDEKLRMIFRRWQWQHQWMVFSGKKGAPIIQPPLKFTPYAQKKEQGFHLPFEKEDMDTSGQVNDGTPDWSSWLCLQPDTASI